VGEITELLNAAPDAASDRLWELVYPELRKRARSLVSRERADHTLSGTAVVNEAFVRLATLGAREWKDRSHFYAVASGIMRHVLIDHARGRAAEKRGGGARRESLDENLFPSIGDDDDGFHAASEALEELASTSERAALVVAMRVFGGLTVEEVSGELDISQRTVKADWLIARVRLQRILAA
jgi:RNA polymerase sigma factor (TIGR02999 family)